MGQSHFKTRYWFQLLGTSGLIVLAFQNCTWTASSSTRSTASAATPLASSTTQPAPSSQSKGPTGLRKTANNTLVFVLAGQSNMEGYGIASQIRPEEKIIPSNVTYYIGSERQSAFGIKDGKFGPEITIAYQLSRTFPGQRIALIKSALGGTSLQRWTLNAVSNSGQVIPNSGDLFRTMQGHIYTVATRDFPGQSFALDGMFWMQGESDANLFNFLGLSYQRNMQMFLEQVDSLLPKSSSFRFVMGRIHNYTTSSMLDNKLDYTQINWKEDFISVRSVQSNLSARFPIRIISTDDLSLQDTWHFDAWSVLSLGLCMGQAYLQDQTHVGCARGSGLNGSYSSDSYLDNRVDSLKSQIQNQYLQLAHRQADDTGLKYWVTAIYRNPAEMSTLQSLLAPPAPVTPTCASQSLASAINGQCHFGFSCVSYSQAQAEISNRAANGYSSCGGVQPTAHRDCMGAFGAARGYLAACPLMRSNETLATNGSTLTGQVADLYKIRRGRNPDIDGLNYWVGQIQSGASSISFLSEALR